MQNKWAKFDDNNADSVQLYNSNIFYKMLKAFLSQNKISLAKLTTPPKPFPSSQPTIPILQQQSRFERNQKPASEPLISAARSPGKRRKIFQKISSPQSQLTADFGEVPNYSTVQAYQLPECENKPKRKMGKTNKENGLCLARAKSKEIVKQLSQDRAVYQSPESHQETQRLDSFRQAESRRQQRVEDLQRYNRQLQKELDEKFKERQEGSLIIVEPNCQTFTFQSQSSLTYSHSRVEWKEPSIQLINTETVLSSPLQLQ